MLKTTAKVDEELLNIKQAAEFLKVSEVSLRRWTDNGKLPCLRIGGKRERRFRRRDLMKFMEDQSQGIQIQSEDAPSGKSTRIMLEGITIDYGNHLCAFYETDLGRIKLSVPFLSDGLQSGDKCYLIAGKAAQKHILKSLAEVGIDTDEVIKSQQLKLHTGTLTSKEMYEFLETSFVMTTCSGEAHIRVLGDMAWALDKGISNEDLIDFEMKYNHSLAKNFPVVSLCQYDARKFSGSGILNALKSHEDTFRLPISRFLNH